MALKRPEGLSPCYASMVSPDIPDSMVFGWTFRGTSSSDYQTKFTITIYDVTGTQVLKTFTKTAPQWYVNISEIGYAFQFDTKYLWKVKTYNKDNQVSPESVFASFYYKSCPVVEPITWTYIPKPGEVITDSTYFKEMRDNVVTILKDYSATSTLQTKASRLFTGEVVPNRDDFRILEEVVNYLSITLEGTTTIDVDGPVEDSLGVTDLERIRNHIDRLITIPPKPVGEIDIETTVPTMYKMVSATASNEGKEDKTVDVVWTVETLKEQTGKFIFKKVSPSRDLRYYIAEFEYGPSSGSFVSELFFKADEITDGEYRTFEMDWDGLYTASTIDEAQHILRVKAVDHRGNISPVKAKTKTYGSSFKVPLGVKQFEVEFQLASVGDTGGPYPDRKWYDIYTGSNKSTVHSIAQAEGKAYYRVKAVDLSGLQTDWKYTGGVLFDPLDPPGVPQGLRITHVGVNDLSIAWNAVATAERYEIHSYRNSGGWVEGTNLGETTSLSKNRAGLSANTTYGFFVRAENRAGVSDWAGVSGRTDKNTHSGYWDSVHAHTWRNDSEGWYPNQGVGHTYVYHGQYGGTGNNRGSWYFSYENMRSVLSGADIVSARMSIQRSGVGGNDTAYSPKIYLHDTTTTEWSKNHSGTPSVLGAGHDPGVAFKKGERKWVSIPVSYIEAIRNGSATGIMLYNPDGGRYMRFETWAQIEVIYKK